MLRTAAGHLAATWPERGLDRRHAAGDCMSLIWPLRVRIPELLLAAITIALLHFISLHAAEKKISNHQHVGRRDPWRGSRP